MLASVVIPTFNGAARVGACLDALLPQIEGRSVEIIVVNDGSTDDISAAVALYPSVTLLNQQNAGPAAARNHGTVKARGGIVLFTDDDCVPTSTWLEEMLRPFDDAEVIGTKGVYRTRQNELLARFVQIEYEDKYRVMRKSDFIDFIDTYSAAFRREKFLEMGGYDSNFPVACAEDVELSYRMSGCGWKMKFAPTATVYHTHPNSLWSYLKKKYKFAFWRIFAVRKNPDKAVKDSHTPQLMKMQLLFLPALLLALLVDVAARPFVPVSWIVISAFLISTLPFSLRAMRKDVAVGILSPILLALRSGAQFFGAVAGVAEILRKPLHANTDPIAEHKAIL
jgi:cellulose synthase/poly-beta-1,6-N-acetylglucosamine synthase-like glycosyltransferase